MDKWLQGKCCLASVTDGPRNLPLKFGQNWVKNCWDIADVEKCNQDKFCLDKCHPDIWHMSSAEDDPRNLSLLFGQNPIISSWALVRLSFNGGCGWWMHKHFRVKSSLGHVRLSLGWIEVLPTLDETALRFNICVINLFWTQSLWYA